MVSNRHHRYTGYWIFSILAGLLCLLIPCTGAWSQGKGLHAEDTRQRSAAKGLHVVVQEGRLSVDLQEADLGRSWRKLGGRPTSVYPPARALGKGSVRVSQALSWKKGSAVCCGWRP